MLKKYDATQDAQPHLPAALPSSEMVVHITGRSFMQRLSGYFCRHELEFWMFQLLLVPLLVLLVLVLFMTVIGLLAAGICSLV